MTIDFLGTTPIKVSIASDESILNKIIIIAEGVWLGVPEVGVRSPASPAHWIFSQEMKPTTFFFYFA